MKIGIVGTSNSVMSTGYVQGLKDAGLEVVANRSLGISHAVAMPYLATPELLDSVDVVVADFAVNEQRALAGKHINPSTTRSSFAHLVRECAVRGITPVVIGLPVRHIKSLYTAAQWQQQFCAENGVPFFDGYRAIQSLGLADRWDDIFRDNHHLHPEFAQMLGRELARCIEDMRGRWRGEPVRKVGGVLSYLPANQVRPDLIIGRKSALVTENVAVLRKGDAARFEIDGGDVVGLLINASETCAPISIAGYTKQLVNQFYDPGVFRLCCWQVIRPVAVSGAFDVSVSTVSSDEASDYYGPDCQEPDDPRVEIAGIVVRRESETGYFWRPFNEPYLN